MQLQKDGLVRAGGFMLGILVLFLAFSFAFSLLPLEWYEQFYAITSLGALNLFGVQGTIETGEPVLIYLDAFPLPVGITYLCTGLLELCVILSAVLATPGVEFRKRTIGAIAATVVLVLFNLFRIVSSILIIHFFGLDIGNFSHDLLFRAFLFLTIAGYYWAWTGWAGKNSVSSN